MEMQRFDHYRPDQKQISRWILVVTLFLIGAGIAMAYLVYADLETAYEELVAAHSTQQDKNKELTRESEKLSKAVANAQARVKSLEKGKRLSERKLSKLGKNSKKLGKDLRELQPAYISEQTKNRKLIQKAEELAKAMEEARARAEDMLESQSISEQEKDRLEAKVSKIETALQVVQRAYIDEQTKSKKLNQKSAELAQVLEDLRARENELKQASPPLQEMEQVRAQLKALEESQKASGKEKGEFKVAGTRLESMLQNLDTAYYAAQAKIDKFTQERAEMIGLIIRLQTEVVVLNYTLGVNYKKLGMNRSAIKAFQTALELDPDHADSHFELARVYDALGERELAMVQFRQYVQLRPYAEDVERVKGWLLRVESELSAIKRAKGWPKGYSSGKSPY